MSNRRSMTDFPRNEAGLVDEFIGTAYDTVKKVYDNIPEIKRLDGVLAEIPELAQTTVDHALDVALPPIMAEMGAEVAKAQQWAEGTQPDPIDPLSKSSKEWSEQSKLGADSGRSDMTQLLAVATSTMDESLVEMETLLSASEAATQVVTQFAGIYPTIAAGLAATVDQAYFSVPSAENKEYLILYRHEGAEASEKKRYPSATALNVVLSLIMEVAASEKYFSITDPEGGTHFTLSKDTLALEAFSIYGSTTGHGFGFTDGEGATPIYADEQRAFLGPLEVRYTDYPSVLVTTDNGEVLGDLTNIGGNGGGTIQTSPINQSLIFHPEISVAEGSFSTIYTSAMLTNRNQVNQLTSGLFSLTTEAANSGPDLKISDQYGDKAVITLRQSGVSDLRATLRLNVKVAPKQLVPKPLTILFVGDSIGNNQGALFLKEYLEALGYAPNFIGTVHGAAITSRYDPNGPLGECRSGWQLADYTFSKSNRAQIVQPGSEADYLGMSKVDQLTYNPFLRAATQSDPVEDIRNGYVFDIAYYQTRFNFPTPDVVINALGTNDATSQPAEGFYNLCFENDKLFNRQISKVWPNTKIVRTVPGTAIDPVRDKVWSEMYTLAILAMKNAALLNSRVKIAPLWAMMSPDMGFPIPTSTPSSDGFLRGTWFDPVHPGGSSRREYYKAMAPFVAVAALNI